MDQEALTAALDYHDGHVRALAAGSLSLAEFLERYGNFYWAYALDGHESELDASVLAALAARIEPHRRIAQEVLATLASDSSPAYLSPGRISAAEAAQRIKLIARGLP